MDPSVRYDAQAAERMRERMTRSMYDEVAKATSMLFIEEFMHAQAGRAGNTSGRLLWGAWPIHPYDDAVARLGAFFAKHDSEGGALRRAIDELSAAPGFDARLAHAVACAEAAEAIGGTSRAWANDAGWKAANFVAVRDEFDAMPECDTAFFDARGGIVCCLNFATFLFAMGRAVTAATPGIDAPFIWGKQDYEGFAHPFAGEDASEEPWRTSGANPSRFIAACESLFGVRAAFVEAGAADTHGEASNVTAHHPCFVRDPFAIALDIAEAVVPRIGAACEQGIGFEIDWEHAAAEIEECAIELASACGSHVEQAVSRIRSEHADVFDVAEGISSRRVRRGLAFVTLCCCIASGREDTAAYCRRRLGDDIGL